MKSYRSGTYAGAGSFQCTQCEFTVTLFSSECVPDCSNCNGVEFSRASIFLDTAPNPTPTSELEAQQDHDLQIQLEELDLGHYLAFEFGARLNIVRLKLRYTRIGRSVRADVRLDDPTVSRRHSIIVLEDDRIEILDDRSLNGVFLNDEKVDRGRLCDGDEITIGCIKMLFVNKTETSSSPDTPSGIKLTPAQT